MMSWSRIFSSFTSANNTNEKPTTPKIALTTQQLQPCLQKFKGNWTTQLDEKLPTINARLNDYLTRYLNEKGINRILNVDCDYAAPLSPCFTRYHIINPIISGERTILDSPLDICPFRSAHYPSSLYANCIVYFANTPDGLKTLHEETVANFNEGLKNAAPIYPHATALSFPPVFLVITEKNSVLHDNNVINALPVPILHSLYIPKQTLLSGSVYMGFNQSMWEGLITNQFAPCFEMLAASAGLIPQAALELSDVKIQVPGYCYFDGNSNVSTSYYVNDSYSDSDANQSSSEGEVAPTSLRKSCPW